FSRDWSSDVCSSDLFDFGQKDDEDTEPVDFSGHTPVGECPKCHHKVYEYGMNYVCEKSVGPDKTCDFRTGKMILQQEISAEQVEIGRASCRERAGMW